MTTEDERRSRELMSKTIERGRDLAETQAELGRHELERLLKEMSPAALFVGGGAVLGMLGAATLLAGTGAVLGRLAGGLLLSGGAMTVATGAALVWVGARRLPEKPLEQILDRLMRDLSHATRDARA